MQSILRSILVGSALVGAVASAQAAAITTLYSTGVDNAGNLLANAAVDGHYAVSPGGGPFVIGNPGGIGWIGNTAGSQWISAAADTLAGGGPFTYTTTFDLTGYDYTTALVSGDLASDNQATIYLNGNNVGSGPFGNWTFFSAFSITSGFQAGINTLTFVVPNFTSPGGNDGPTGVQVHIRSATADLPEPGSLALGSLALILAVAASRRRAA